MFEAVSKTSQIQNKEVISNIVESSKPSQEVVKPKVSSKPSQEVKKPKVSSKPSQEVKKPKEQQPGKNEKTKSSESQISDQLLGSLEEDFQLIHNVALDFSLHEATGRTMVKVFNKDNDELIREIPPEQILDLAARLDEMVGMLFDQEV